MSNKLLELARRPAAPAVFVAAGIASALVLQHLLGWAPCPLCILQRLTAIGLCLSLSVRAFFGDTAGRKADVALACVMMSSLGGVWAAGTHLWILLGPQSGSCDPGVARFVGHLVDALPGSAWLLEGGGTCEDTRYELLRVPLPAWSGALHLAGAGWAAQQRFLQRGN